MSFAFSVTGVALLCLCLVVLLKLAKTLFQAFVIKWKLSMLGVPQLKKPPFVDDLLDAAKPFGGVPGIPRSVYVLQYFTGLGRILKDDDMFRVGLGPFSYVLLRSPEAVEVLLSNTREVKKSKDYEALTCALGTGLLTSSVETWKIHRRIINPAFHVRILDEYLSAMHSCSERMVSRLRSEAGKPYIDLDPFIKHCTLEIILCTAMAVDMSWLKGKTLELLEALQFAKELLFKRIVSPWMWLDAIFWLIPEGRRLAEYLHLLTSLTSESFYKMKKSFEASKDMPKDMEDLRNNERNVRRVFTEILLSSNVEECKNRLSDQEILDEVATFAIAGFDTSSTCLTFTFYLIGLHAEVQAKVHEELDGIFGTDLDRPVTAEDLKLMHYLTRVIKESLRLYPPIPIIARQLTEDLKIKNVTLPKGVTVLASQMMMHMDPLAFPNPDVFDPDRFLLNNWHPFSYIPFSVGPRNCVGQAFAMQEMKIVLASVLRKFKITSLDPRDKVILCPELISQPLKFIRTKVDIRR